MAFEYEALVGHLYVVGGRSISAAPPGTLVEVAPRKAARGREADTFFVLVLPSGETIAPAAFYEQMSQLSAEKYFNSSGSVTAGLRSVFNALNENLYEHNLDTTQPTHYEANVLCAVLRGNDLYLAKVGAGVALFRHGDDLQSLPADLTNDEALFGPPLGVQPVPAIKMARYEVETGTRLVLADVGLADVGLEAIKPATDAPNIGELLVALRAIGPRQMILTAVEFVPPAAPAPLATAEGESTRKLGKPRAAADPKADAKADPAPETLKPPRPSRLEIPLRTGLSRGSFALGRLFGLFGRLLDMVMPPPPKDDRRSLWSHPAVAGLTVFIPLLVVILVLVMWLSGTGASEFDLCVEEAERAGETARSIPSSDVPGTLAAWNAVIEVTESCNDIREGDVTILALTAEAQQVIDYLLQIDRRDPIPLASIPQAGLTRVVLQGDDLYTLDNSNDLVYRVKLTPDGRSVVAGSQQPIQSMRRTAAVEEFVLGDIFDIAWAEDDAGLSQGNVLVALDRTGVLVECPPRFLDSLSCEAQRLPNVETWGEPVAMYFWQGRLYLLDPGANQIWRYDPGPGAYTNVPIEYFVGEGRPDIRRAIDFAIDDTGNVYILMNDGVIARFRSAEQQPFGFASFPDNFQLASADAMFLNTDPIAQGLYIVNRNNRTIYETTMAGTFIAAYRALDEDLFAGVADVVVDMNLQMIYVASGNSIFGFEREPTAPQP